MAEEAVAELYAEITAKPKNFEEGLDLVEKRLGNLEDTQISVQDETKSTETGLRDLSMEGLSFGGMLTSLLDKIYESSGALNALTTSVFGYIGAALDTFILQSLVPALQDAGGWLVEQRENLGDILDMLPGYKTETDAATGSTKELGTMTNLATVAEGRLAEAFADGKLIMDEFGNAILVADGQLLYWDGTLLETTVLTDDLDQSMKDLLEDSDLVDTVLADFADLAGIRVEDLLAHIQGGTEAVVALLASVDKTGSEEYLNNVATAAVSAIEYLGEFMVTIGIDPRTGESISWESLEAEYRSNRLSGLSGPVNRQIMMDYMFSGQ